MSTDVYLINSLPTPKLQLSSPFTKLFTKDPDYTFLRFFGYACYLLLRPYAKHKLEFKSKQCVFIGNSANKKGNMCLDLSSNRTYILRHLIFDEMVFPAQGSATSSSITRADSAIKGIVLDPSHFYSINNLSNSDIHHISSSALCTSSLPLNSPCISSTLEQATTAPHSEPCINPVVLFSSFYNASCNRI